MTKNEKHQQKANQVSDESIIKKVLRFVAKIQAT